MSTAGWWQGLKKSVIGLFFFLIAADILFAEYIRLDDRLSNVDVNGGSYIFVFILWFAHHHIGNVYNEKIPTQPALLSEKQQKFWRGLGFSLVVTGAMVLDSSNEEFVSSLLLVQSIFLTIAWIFWDRKGWFALLLASSLAFVSFVPLFIVNDSLATILVGTAIGIAFFAAGMIEHRTLMRQAVVIASAVAPEV
jgi:hypothetical protein